MRDEWSPEVQVGLGTHVARSLGGYCLMVGVASLVAVQVARVGRVWQLPVSGASLADVFRLEWGVCYTYSYKMIRSFKSRKLEQCWRAGRCAGISPQLRRRINMKLDYMDGAACLEDLRMPRGNNLHSLSGDQKGKWSLHVNGPWSLVFRESSGDFYEVELIQYH